jgi:hypothetical protein
MTLKQSQIYLLTPGDVFEVFLETRSYNQTAQRLNEEGYRTKMNADFTTLAVKDLISNPVADSLN